MDRLHELWAPLAAYPRWFVLLCLVVVAAGVGWLVMKLLKWTFYVVILFAVLALVLAAVAWFLG